MRRIIGLGLACTAMLVCGLWTTHSSDKVSGITYAKDVAPIIQKNCIVCHRPGEIAPMSLLTYKDVRPWAKSTREMVVERRMPPSFADPRDGAFSNDCRLPQKDIPTTAAAGQGGSKE